MWWGACAAVAGTAGASLWWLGAQAEAEARAVRSAPTQRVAAICEQIRAKCQGQGGAVPPLVHLEGKVQLPGGAQPSDDDKAVFLLETVRTKWLECVAGAQCSVTWRDTWAEAQSLPSFSLVDAAQLADKLELAHAGGVFGGGAVSMIAAKEFEAGRIEVASDQLDATNFVDIESVLTKESVTFEPEPSAPTTADVNALLAMPAKNACEVLLGRERVVQALNIGDVVSVVGIPAMDDTGVVALRGGRPAECLSRAILIGKGGKAMVARQLAAGTGADTFYTAAAAAAAASVGCITAACWY